MAYGDWFSCIGEGTLVVGKATDGGLAGDGGHWVTIDGHHVLIGTRSPKTRRDFEADVKKGPDAFFRNELRTKEHGDRSNHNLDADSVKPPLGHYQFLDSTLVDLELKHRPGNRGWEDTPFAHAYGINTNKDFTRNDAAQDAALAQYAKRVDSEILPLKTYVGHRYLTADGQFVTVTQAGLFAAIHKQGGAAVRAYLAKNKNIILSDVQGKGLGRTRAYDPNDKDDNSDRNVEGRLQWAQYFNYEPGW